MPEAFHCTVTFPPLGVSGIPEAKVSKNTMREDVDSVPVALNRISDSTWSPERDVNVLSAASAVPEVVVLVPSVGQEAMAGTRAADRISSLLSSGAATGVASG